MSHPSARSCRTSRNKYVCPSVGYSLKRYASFIRKARGWMSWAGRESKPSVTSYPRTGNRVYVTNWLLARLRTDDRCLLSTTKTADNTPYRGRHESREGTRTDAHG